MISSGYRIISGCVAITIHGIIRTEFQKPPIGGLRMCVDFRETDFRFSRQLVDPFATDIKIGRKPEYHLTFLNLMDLWSQHRSG